METTPYINSAEIVSGVSQAVNETVGLITDLLPLALTIFATMWGVRKALQFFKRTAN